MDEEPAPSKEQDKPPLWGFKQDRHSGKQHCAFWVWDSVCGCKAELGEANKGQQQWSKQESSAFFRGSASKNNLQHTTRAHQLHPRSANLQMQLPERRRVAWHLMPLVQSCQEDYAIAGFDRTEKHLSAAACDHPHVSSNGRLLIRQGFTRVGNPTSHPGLLATSLAKTQTRVKQAAASVGAVCLWAMQ